MLYIRFFMEFHAYTVSAEVAHDAESVFLGMFLNSGTHIAQLFPRLCGGNTNFHTLFRHLDQFAHFGTYVADHKHAGGVREVSIVNGRDIHIDNISVFQDFILVGYPMAYYVVNACTDTLGESFVIEGSRNGSVTGREIIY